MVKACSIKHKSNTLNTSIPIVTLQWTVVDLEVNAVVPMDLCCCVTERRVQLMDSSGSSSARCVSVA